MKGGDCSDDDAADALCPSKPLPKVHTVKGMDGGRDGLPHLTPMSTRYRVEHEKRGTQVEMPGKM